MSKDEKKIIDLHEEMLKNKKKRDENAKNTHVIDKVKKLHTLPDDFNATIEMAATYFEVDKEALNSLIKDNRTELESDGLVILKGSELKDFVMSLKDMANIVNPKTRSLTLIPRRAILRMGQLLRYSKIAIEVRNQLLNIEQIHRGKTPHINFATLDRMVERNSTRQGNQEIKQLLRDQVGARGQKHFSDFFAKGYEGSYKVKNLSEYRIIKGLPEKSNPLDHMDSLELASYRFRIEMTRDRIESQHVDNTAAANNIHKNIGENVAKLVEDMTGKRLIELPVKSHIKKLENGVKKEHKRLKSKTDEI